MDLEDLASGLASTGVSAQNKAIAIEKCVEFVLAETKGMWHGRARAMMCRRLKHCELGLEQRRQLVTCITGRLATGNFSEQFRDQLRLTILLDPKGTFEVALECLTGSKAYVRRLAKWVVDHEGRQH